MSVNKILAEFMGLKRYPAISRSKAAIQMGGPLIFEKWPCGCVRKKVAIALATHCHDKDGEACNWGWDPTASRDDLQLVVEKLNLKQWAEYRSKMSQTARKNIGDNDMMISYYARELSTATLARLISEVIEGSNSDGQ